MQIGVPEDTLAGTAERYERDREDREERFRRFETEGIVGAEDPARLALRLARLGADQGVTDSVAQGAADVSSILRGTAARPEDDPYVYERVLGANDLVGVSFLHDAARAARSVGRITVRTEAGGVMQYGTGFMISPSLLITNNHVLKEKAWAERSSIEFDYERADDGSMLASTYFDLAPDAFFVTDPKLDFTIVGVKQTAASGGGELADYGWNPLVPAQGKAAITEWLNVIQHPNGEPKQLSLRENRLVGRLEDFLHYETDTAPGSSGSPVMNDQWEVVAVHHSGVPDRDAEGRVLALDGQPWTPAMGEHRVKWIANEGARVSRIVEELERASLSGAQAELRTELLTAAEAAQPAAGARGTAAGGRDGVLVADASDGSLEIPIRLSLRVSAAVDAPGGAATRAPGGAATSAPAKPVAAPAASPADSRDLREALKQLEAAKDRPYYDASADAANRDRYYEAIDPDAEPAALHAALAELLERTHTTEPRYKPMVHVYPWVDLRPDLQLRSIYSDKPFDPKEVIESDARAMEARAAHRESIGATEAALAEQRTWEFDVLEAVAPFNCEHVVPQSWFGKEEPMRGDLHHLFTCESPCNSFRGNTPYWEFPDFEEALRTDCGKREGPKFEPTTRKGTVARAVLYFLLRYPGEIDDEEVELEAKRLEILLGWHAAEPPDEYERHRNAAIFEAQGNRNPLIDFPDWATRIDFSRGLGRRGRFQPAPG